MHAHRIKLILTGREVTLKLPENFPLGEAEVIVLADHQKPQVPFDVWLRDLLSTLPPTPDIPLEAFSRENLYE